MKIQELQDNFIDSLFIKGKARVLNSEIESNKADAIELLSIHRNNINIGLIEELEKIYPNIWRALGKENAVNLARRYISDLKNFPCSYIDNAYGDEMPDFISNVAEFKQIPYLSDLAKLDLARSKAYHLDNNVALTIEQINNIAEEKLLESKVNFIDSLILLQSHFSLLEIEEMLAQNKTDVKLKANLYNYIIFRDEEKILTHQLNENMFNFIYYLYNEHNFEKVISDFTTINGFNISNMVEYMIGNKLIKNLD